MPPAQEIQLKLETFCQSANIHELKQHYSLLMSPSYSYPLIDYCISNKLSRPLIYLLGDIEVPFRDSIVNDVVNGFYEYNPANNDFAAMHVLKALEKRIPELGCLNQDDWSFIKYSNRAEVTVAIIYPEHTIGCQVTILEKRNILLKKLPYGY